MELTHETHTWSLTLCRRKKTKDLFLEMARRARFWYRSLGRLDIFFIKHWRIFSILWGWRLLFANKAVCHSEEPTWSSKTEVFIGTVSIEHQWGFHRKYNCMASIASIGRLCLPDNSRTAEGRFMHCSRLYIFEHTRKKPVTYEPKV